MPDWSELMIMTVIRIIVIGLVAAGIIIPVVMTIREVL